MRDKKKEMRLNEAVREWKRLGAADEARRDALWGDIFLLAFEMFDDGSERFLSVFQETLMNYSLEKGPFSNYFSFVYSRRKKDAFDDVLSRSEQIDSFDKPVGEDESTTLQDRCAAPDAEQPEARYAAEAPLEELTAQILNFAQRHQGQASNERRREWFRLFYTEDMTESLKLVALSFMHERDVFEAMKLPYLDFYMAERCRSMAKITETPLKPYSAVVPERKDVDTETPVPLPADVSLSFKRICEGERVGASARSEQYKRYKAEKEMILEALKC